MKSKSSIKNLVDTAHKKYLLACATVLTAQSAHADAFTVAGFNTLACSIIQWMTGELATIIFFMVVVITLVVGFFAKMDWSKILSVIILMGILKGVPTLLNNTASISTYCTAITG